MERKTMKRRPIFLAALVPVIILVMSIPLLPPVKEAQSEPESVTSVLIVYHGGQQTSEHEATPLDAEKVDALTQATTENVNVKSVASKISARLSTLGYRV